MSILATAYPANPVRTKDAQRVAWIYAGILVVMAITQLVSLTKFTLVLDSYWLAGGMQFAAFLAGALVAAELLSLAFLLRLKLSPAFRLFTMGLSWIVPLIWIGLTIEAVATVNNLTNVGFLGGYITLIPGWWAVFISVALAILSAWATWGLWPLPFKRTKTHKK